MPLSFPFIITGSMGWTSVCLSVFAGGLGPMALEGVWARGSRGADGQVQTETRRLNLDPFQTDILYI